LSAELTKMHSFRLFFGDFAHWVRWTLIGEGLIEGIQYV